jgi:hypothetical protein
LDVDRLSLIEGGVERVGRWSQDRTGTITAFLTGAVGGPQSLSLHGRLPTIFRRAAMAAKSSATTNTTTKPSPAAKASSGPAASAAGRAPSGATLPLVQIEGCENLSSTVQLFRQPTVQVVVRNASGLVKLEDLPVEPGRAELGRLVYWFRVESDQAQAELVVSRSDPKIHAEQVTRLWHDGKAWQAEIDFRLRLSGGALDELRLDVPASFAGPYQVTPAESFKVVDAAGEGRQLILQPRQEIAADYRFRISSPLTRSSGDRIAPPDVLLKQAGPAKRYFVLPEQLGQQRIAWDTWGMKLGQLPAGFSAPVDGGPVAVYELTGRQFRANLRSSEQARSTARVRLADISFAWQADGACRGVAIFDLEPSKSLECPLWLPHGYRLVQATVDGLPATLTPAGANAWQVHLGPSRSPQRLEVIFAGTLRNTGESLEQRLDAPSLGNLPVAASLWTVAPPAGCQIDSCEVSEPIAPWKLQIARLRNVAALTQAAAAANTDKRESLDAYRYWARQFVGARRVIDREWPQAEAGKAMRVTEEEIHAIDREQAQLAESIGAGNVLEKNPAEEATIVNDAQLLWQASLAPVARRIEVRPRLVTYAFSDGIHSLTLLCRAEGSDNVLRRLPSAAGLAALVLLGALAARRKPVAAMWQQWPQAVGILVALAWWLWLWPSWLGPVILLVCLFATVNAAWKRFAGSSTKTGATVSVVP